MPEKLLTFTADKQAPALGCQPQIRTSVLDISTKFLQSRLKYFQKTTHLELILRTWQTLQVGAAAVTKVIIIFSAVWCLCFGKRLRLGK